MLRHRPVGESMPWRHVAPFKLPDTTACFWTRSGTQALALALALVIEKAERQVADLPEVLLPAYGCPDMVSAILINGCQPVFVDLTKDSFEFSFDALQRSVSATTIAAILPHFLGIEHEATVISKYLEQHSIGLIEDSAQRFPPLSFQSGGSALSILSFGRGKPISGFGGGAVIGRGYWQEAINRSASTLANGAEPEHVSMLLMSRVVHNISLNPVSYSLLSRLPMLHIGETRFKPLKQILQASPARVRMLKESMGAFDATPSIAQQRYCHFFSAFENQGWIDLATRFKENGRLLRYPLLAPSIEARDRLFKIMDSAGLGVSRMYVHPLPDIVESSYDDMQQYPNALSFANRLITMPCHSGITEGLVRTIQKTFTKSI